VSAWTDVFLGVIAAATLVMAAVQVLVIGFGARLARQVERLTRQVDDEIRPLLANLAAVSRDATLASSRTLDQIERVDRLVADVITRVDETVTIVQQVITAPIREGRAVLSAVAATIAALRAFTGAGEEARRPPRVDDEDPLFIG
jgi:predicted PurR-regulated permease PerM